MTSADTTRAQREQHLLDEVPKGLRIGGEWLPGEAGEIAVEDPATGATLAYVADASPQDGLAALAAAHDAQQSWAATAPRERSEILRTAYELLTARADDFALLMTMEMGKPLAEARGEVAYGADFFRWFAEEAVRIDGRWTVSPDGASRFLVMKQPVGPVLMVLPWNFPLAMGTRKLGPALAAGCTAVVKPATQTPLTTLLLAKVLSEAGVPDGVVNVIPTSSAGEVVEPLLRDSRLRKLTFTGSTQVGRTLIEQSAQQVLRVSMELGGNAPLLVFADADLDLAVEQTMVAKMRNMGQACTAANRLYVHADIADAFAAKLTERMRGLVLGRGTQDGVTLGPLIDAKALDKVDELVADAVAAGATVALGGERRGGEGYFYAPTVLTDVPREARLQREEIFGPVAPVTTFTSDDEAVAMANDTEFGLMSYVFTTDLSRAIRVSERLAYGMVGLNTGLASNAAAPFGGVKASGFGREGGAEGIEEYLETKYVGLRL